MSGAGGGTDDVRPPTGNPTHDDPDGPVSHRHAPGQLTRFLASTRTRVALVVVAALAVGLVAGGLLFGDRQAAAPPVTAAPEPSRAQASQPEFQPVATVQQAPRPITIAVPDLGIDQEIIDLTVSDAGKMGVPAEWMDIGWWADGPAPGESGGAVIAGHVNGAGKPAVFAQLPTLAVGAEVVVTREDGSAARYVVRTKEQFPKDDFPDARVYTFEGPSYLHLVTCGGAFDTRSGHYDDNIVVFAELVGVTPA